MKSILIAFLSTISTYAMPPKLHQLQCVIAHDGRVNAISIGPKTAYIFASGGEDKTVNLWQVGSNNPRIVFGPFQSEVTAVKINDTEELLLVGTQSGGVTLFDLNVNKCLSTWSQNKAEITSLAFSPVNPEIALATDSSGLFNVFSITQRRPLQSYSNHIGRANYVTTSPDGRLACTCGDDRTIKVYDLTRGRQVASFEGHTDCVTCAVFHQGGNLIVSCGADRTIRFFSLDSKEEIPNDLTVDSSPVDVVTFTPDMAHVASLSSDYLKFVTINPLTLDDAFTVGLETIHDFQINDAGITIASSNGDQLMIHRTQLSFFKPFRGMTMLDAIDQPKMKPPTPRLLDIAELQPNVRNRVGTQRNSPPVGKPPAKVRSKKSPESDIVPPKKATPSKPAPKQSTAATTRKTAKPPRMSGDIFVDFKKGRAGFLGQMNDRYSRLLRVSDSIGQRGLTAALDAAAGGADTGPELLMIVRMKPEVVRLEQAALILKICNRISTKDTDLAMSTVSYVMETFGSLVQSTLEAPSPGGVDLALEERKKHGGNFVEAFRSLVPFLRKTASTASSVSDVASEILAQWRCFTQ